MTLRMALIAALPFALAGCMSVGGLIGGDKPAPDPAFVQCVTNAGGKLIEIEGPNGKIKTCKMPDGAQAERTDRRLTRPDPGLPWPMKTAPQPGRGAFASRAGGRPFQGRPDAVRRPSWARPRPTWRQSGTARQRCAQSRSGAA